MTHGPNSSDLARPSASSWQMTCVTSDDQLFSRRAPEASARACRLAWPCASRPDSSSTHLALPPGHLQQRTHCSSTDPATAGLGLHTLPELVLAHRAVTRSSQERSLTAKQARCWCASSCQIVESAVELGYAPLQRLLQLHGQLTCCPAGSTQLLQRPKLWAPAAANSFYGCSASSGFKRSDCWVASPREFSTCGSAASSPEGSVEAAEPPDAPSVHQQSGQTGQVGLHAHSWCSGAYPDLGPESKQAASWGKKGEDDPSCASAVLGGWD